MTLSKTYFTYCDEDQSVIDQIVAGIGKDKVSFEHDMREEARQRLTRKAMREDKVPVWLFISDQFLLSSDAMNNLLSFLEDPVLSVYIQPVIIGSLKPDEAYIKHWDSEYWAIRARKDQIPSTELETYNWRVIIIRSISNEIKEFLNHLKSFKIISLEEFEKNNYEYFYETQGIEILAPVEERPPVITEPASVIEAAPLVEIPTAQAEKVEIQAPEIEPVPEPVVLAEAAIEVVETEVVPLTRTSITSPIEEPGKELPIIGEATPQVAEEEPVLPQAENIPVPEQEETVDPQPGTREEIAVDEEIKPTIKPFEPLFEIGNEASWQIVPQEEPREEPPSFLNEAEKEAFFREAIKHARRGNHQKAIKLLKDILKQDPDDAMSNYHYGVLLQDFIGETDEAFSHLEKVMEVGTDNEDVYIRLGVLAENREDAFLARNFYEKAITLNPEKAYTYYRLGLLIMRNFDRQLPQALSYFERSILLSPGQANAHFHYGQLLMELGHYKKAERELRVAVTLDPDHQFAHYELAKAYLQLKKNKKAYKYYQLACQANEIFNTPSNNKLFRLKRKEDKDKTTKNVKKHKKSKKIAFKIKLEDPKKTKKKDKQKSKDKVLMPLAKTEKKQAVAEKKQAKKKEIQAKPPKETGKKQAKKKGAKPEVEPKAKKKEKVAKVKEPKPKKSKVAEKITVEESGKASKKEKQPKKNKQEEAPQSQAKKEELPAAAPKAAKHKAAKLVEEKIIPLKVGEPQKEAEPSLEITEQETTRRPIALITGATAGIGRSSAFELAKMGYDLVITGRRELRLHKLKRKLKKAYGIKVKPLAFDLRSEEAVNNVMDSLSDRWKNIDVLVNNAGLAKGREPIHKGDTSHWNAMIDTNIKGLLYITLAVAPGMVERGSGHIVNVGSVAGKEVYPNGGVYCATKHAVEALTKGMRMDFLEHGIRVSSVSPGHVHTEFALVRYEGDEERVATGYEGFDPLRPEDVAEVVSFIISRPPSVNVQDVLLFSSQQASALIIDRRKK